MPLFERAISKLNDAKSSLEQLCEAEDADQFRAAFNSFVTHARAVTNALQKTGAHADDFSDWYAAKQEEMSKDDLMCYFHKARVDNFHKGEPLLEVHDPAPIESGYSTTKWFQRGTVYESGPYGTFQRPDIAPQPRITVIGAPNAHRGRRIDDPAPIPLCQLALSYLAELVSEAEEKLGSTNG